jgi:methyl-accepting chemotaxis protein
VNPLLIGPSLVVRALDDLHAIALAAASLEDIERRINERLGAIVALGEGVDDRLAQVLELGDRIVALGARVDEITERVDRIDARAESIMTTGEGVEQAAKDVAVVGRQIADALPVLQRAITMAEPLEGAVERLGRIVDRLPGGMRARSGA